MSAPRLSKPEAVPVTLRMWMRKNKLATMVIISLSLLLALSQAQVQHEVNHHRELNKQAAEERRSREWLERKSRRLSELLKLPQARTASYLAPQVTNSTCPPSPPPCPSSTPALKACREKLVRLSAAAEARRAPPPPRLVKPAAAALKEVHPTAAAAPVLGTAGARSATPPAAMATATKAARLVQPAATIPAAALKEDHPTAAAAPVLGTAGARNATPPAAKAPATKPTSPASKARGRMSSPLGKAQGAAPKPAGSVAA